MFFGQSLLKRKSKLSRVRWRKRRALPSSVREWAHHNELYVCCPFNLKLELWTKIMPCNNLQQFMKRKSIRKKRSPLRILPLHPQQGNISLLQTGLQSHQKQTRGKNKIPFWKIKRQFYFLLIYIHTE